MSPRLLTAFLCLLSFSLVAKRGEAQVIAYTWSGNSTNNGAVTDGTNWGGSGPSGVGGFENLIFDASGPQTNVLFPTFASASLTFGSARPAYTLSGTGVTPVLTVAAAYGVNVAAGATVTFASSLGLNLAAGVLTGDDHTFNIAAATTLQINGVISGAGHLTKTGAGTLVLTGANTYNYLGGLGFLDSTSINAGTLHLNGGSINHTGTGDVQISLNAGGSGALLINNGGNINDYFGVLAQGAGSTATATVSGTGSYWANSAGMDIGRSGTGTVNIQSGADVTIAGPSALLGWTSTGNGTVNVDGAGSTWTAAGELTVGNAGQGAVNISNSGQVTSLSGYLGKNSGSTGTVTIAGTGSLWSNTAEVIVGNSGSGSLSVTGGGDVTNTYSYIATQSGSTGAATVDGAGSTWTNTGLLAVGQGGTGSLTISNGGVVSSNEGYVGYAASSVGTATVTGSGSAWNNSLLLTVASAGTGTLTLANSGTVNVNSGAGTLTLGDSSGSTGTLNIGAAAAAAAAAGGIVNAATITTSAGTGNLQFKTTATSGTPYYLTKDGLSGGTAVAVTGTTKVINTAGYNVLTGTNTYTSGTVVNGGTLRVTGSITHLAADTLVNGTGSTPALVISGGGDLTNDRLRLGITDNTHSGAVWVDGSGSTVTNATYLYVGEAGTGLLNVLNGGTVSGPNTSIGNNATGVGTVNVTGTGSTLVNTSTLHVGSAGDGTLTVAGGGTVTNLTGVVGNDPGGVGDVSVDGSGSTWTNTGSLTVGSASDGYVAAFNSGSITAASATIGDQAGVTGDLATFTGGSFSTTGNLVVGNNGFGSLSVSSGSVTTGGQAILANNTGSTGAVYLDNSGGLWTVGSDLYIGNAGSGFMRAIASSVLNVGGVAGTGTIHLGHTGGTGILEIGYDGEGYNPGSVINASSIITGTGSGIVLFGTSAAKGTPYYFTKDGTSGGAFVTITGTTQVQHIAGYNVLGGASTYTGGTSITGGTLVATTAGALGTGPVQLNGGSLSVSPGVTLGNALTFTAGGGTLGGNGTFSAATTIGTNARLSPGNSVGTLTFSGGLTMASGGSYDLEIQTAGGAAGIGYDLLSISGAALDITATSGSPFTLRLISLNGVGALGNVTDFSSSNPYAWTIASSAAGITGFAADKFVVTTPNFTNSLGIGNFYVTQSGNDLILNFTPVPEPSTYALMAAGLALAGLCRRRRKS